MKTTTRKAYVNVTDQAHDFLKKHFSAARKGAMYILESMPSLFETALVEGGLTETQKKLLYKSIAELVICPVPTGNLLLEVAPGELMSKIRKLPQFTRAMIELDASQQNPYFRPPAATSNGHVVGIEVSAAARKFVESKFSRFGSGASFLLNQIPDWCADALRSVSDELRFAVEQAMRPIKPEISFLAGSLLLPRLRTLSGSDIKIPKLPAFTVFALEVSGMVGEKKVVRSSPKCFPSTFDELADIFGSDNAGVTQAITMMPHLFRATVNEEIQGRFTSEEMDMMRSRLEEAGGANPYVPGETIGVISRQFHEARDPDCEKELVRKMKKLSIFGRACLEVLLERG